MVSFNSSLPHNISFSHNETSTDQGSEPYSLNVFGLNIDGLSLSNIKQASFHLSVPLKSGHKKLIHKGNKIYLQTKPGTNLDVIVNINRNQNGKPRLSSLILSFSHKITVKNPTMCLNLADENRKRTALDSVKDQVADLRIRDMVINGDGEIEVGSSIKALKVIKKRINPRLAPVNTKSLEAKFLNALGINEGTPPFLEQKSHSHFRIDELLKNIGALTHRGTYKITLQSDQAKTSLRGKNIEIHGEKSVIDAQISGQIKVDHRGNIHIETNKEQTHVKSSFGTHNIKIDAKIRHLGSSKNTKVDFYGELTGKTGNLDANAISHNAIKDVMPRRPKKHSPSEEDSLSFNTSFGTKAIDLDMRVTANASITPDKSLKSLNSSIKTTANIHDPYALSMDRGVKLDGNLLAKVELEQNNFKSNDTFVNASGNASIKVKPSAQTLSKFPGIKNYGTDFSFSLYDDKHAQITVPSHGVTNFFRSVKNLEGNYERVNTKFTKRNIYPIGTKPYFRQIKTITGSQVRKARNVELLVDGISSMPKRLQLIQQAQKYICFQTLVFKNDDSGWAYASALVDAAKRGVKVFGVVDSLGNIESLKDLAHKHPIYDFLRKNGVELYIYNAFVEDSLREIFSIVNDHQDVFHMPSPESNKNIHELIKFFQKIMDVLDGPKLHNFSEANKRKLARCLHSLFGGKTEVSTQSVINEIREALETDRLGLIAILSLVKRIGDMSFRWHEKYLIADGEQAIVGGMNIADEYLKGGTNEILNLNGKEQLPWRDTDVYLEGDAVVDVCKNFRRNWYSISRKKLEFTEQVKHHQDGKNVVILQHRPFEDGDHNITNFFLYNLRTLKAGECAWFETAYFLPRGALLPLKEELINAAKRGVDVRILTNSEATSDFGPLVSASLFDLRDLLANNVKIFLRNEGRMVHSKTTLLGNKLSVVGSWNFDNRSAAHDSEDACAVYDKQVAQKTKLALMRDMFEQSYELNLQDINSQPLEKELRSAAMLLGGELF